MPFVNSKLLLDTLRDRSWSIENENLLADLIEFSLEGSSKYWDLDRPHQEFLIRHMPLDTEEIETLEHHSEAEVIFSGETIYIQLGPPDGDLPTSLPVPLQ